MTNNHQLQANRNESLQLRSITKIFFRRSRRLGRLLFFFHRPQAEVVALFIAVGSVFGVIGAYAQKESTGSALIIPYVPNEGDPQINQVLSAALYQFLYIPSDEGRKELWRQLWIDFVDDEHVPYDMLPPRSSCPSVEFPKEVNAKGSFRYGFFENELVSYSVGVGVPPFAYFTLPNDAKSKIMDSPETPFTEAHGFHVELLKGMLQKIQANYGKDIIFSGTYYSQQNCDYRDIADNLYNGNDDFFMGFTAKNKYRLQFFNFTCPYMMSGKFSLVTGYLKIPPTPLSRWNSNDIKIGTISYLPWKDVKTNNFPNSTFVYYADNFHLLTGLMEKKVHGILIPPPVYTLIASKIKCDDIMYACQLAGEFGNNTYETSLVNRRYPNKQYINTYFDQSYLPHEPCDKFV